MSVESSIQGYSDRTLAGIIRDLRKNPMTARKGSWEANRLVLLEAEHRRRAREDKESLTAGGGR
jgi:hypothetical protein